jgi:molybdopterin/thiamine biosynthesis adenylyltransferase
MLADEQIERYSRQIILPQVGGKGQEKLFRASVLVNGTGPLQEVALLYLAAVGIGTIGVLTDDEAGLFSALMPESLDALTTVPQRLNPECTVVRHKRPDRNDVQYLSQLVEGYMLVVSGPDLRLHDACYTVQRPFLCVESTGTQCWLLACRGYEANYPCLHCIALPSEEEARPLFADLAALFLGAQIATEVVKMVLGLNQSGGTTLFRCEFPDLHFDTQHVRKDPDCLCCGRSVSS